MNADFEHKIATGAADSNFAPAFGLRRQAMRDAALGKLIKIWRSLAPGKPNLFESGVTATALQDASDLGRISNGRRFIAINKNFNHG